MSKTLKQWLSWMESCHPDEIELGLERCIRVLKRLLTSEFSFPVVTIAGTNGKGSTVAVLEALAKQAKMKPLVFTSPHFLDYRERLKFDGNWLSEQQHINAFEAVESARLNETLTYFEFATLAALKCAEQLQPDILILETGLGGRLDAVNVLAADIAIITTIDYDHQDWLGDDLESIAREKAGIIHNDKIAIIADPAFPESIIKEIELTTEQLYLADKEFKHFDKEDYWSWQNSSYGPWQLSYPTFPSANASAALQAWSLLRNVSELTEDFVEQALSNIALSGRFEIVAREPAVILDVAHNPQAFRVLVSLLSKQQFNGETHLILGMLEDKNAQSCLGTLMPITDRWYLADLQGSRGRSANNLKQLLPDSENDENRLQCYSSVMEAFNAACNNASKDDRIIVTGSFYTVAPVLAFFKQRSLERAQENEIPESERQK